MIERDPEAFEDVCAIARLVEFVLGAAPDDDFAMRDEVLQHRAQAEHLRFEGLHHARHRCRRRHEREHVETEARLQRRMFVELVEHDRRRRVTLEVDDDADALTIALVREARDAGNRFLRVGFRNRFHDTCRRHLERHFGNDDLAFSVNFDDLGFSAHHHGATARLVRRADDLIAHQNAARGKVRS